jgi:hypothetical protein
MKTKGNLNAYFAAPVERFERTVYHEELRQMPVLNASVLITADDPTLAQMALRFRANRDWELAGTNAVDGCATFADGGGVKLTTTGTSGDQVILQAQQDTNQTALAAVKFNTDDSPAFLASVKTGDSVADATLWTGMKLTSTGAVASDNDQAYFRYNPAEGDGKWQAVVSRDGVDVAVALGEEAVAADTAYQLVVALDQDRRALFYINGQLWHTTVAGLKADVDLKPFVGVQTNAAAGKKVIVREIAVSKLRND